MKWKCQGERNADDLFKSRKLASVGTTVKEKVFKY
jgi:hypothetical protein